MKPTYRIFLFVLLSFIVIAVDTSHLYAGDSIERIGDVLQYVLPATAAAMIVVQKDGKGAIQFGESTALTLGVTYGLKYTFDEERPNGGSHSFPSMHSSISFSSAEFLRERYGWEYGIPAYLAATFVAYSRVESDEHYTRDVIAGALIGIAASAIFTTSYQGVQIQPEITGKYPGARLSYRW
jgi:membrane-associated phospholipid phosphatase